MTYFDMACILRTVFVYHLMTNPISNRVVKPYMDLMNVQQINEKQNWHSLDTSRREQRVQTNARTS
jgi:hypothetical protein